MADKIDVAKLAREAGWSGLYIEWAKPTGKPDWKPAKVSLTVPVTQEQIEHFARLVMEECAKVCAAMPVFQKSAQGDYDRTTPLDCAIAIREQMP
jgi:hypothetical protein